jgi:hypothetical protein
MYLKKHLPCVRIVEGIIFSLFFLNACVESSKPDKYIARVNDSYLTKEELSELTDTSISSEENTKEIVRNWVKKELLFQQAENEGIVDERAYKKIIEDSKKQLAGALLLKKIASEKVHNFLPKELEEYFNNNKSSFILSSNFYLLNRIKFNNYSKAVQFRSELISKGWDSALEDFQNDTSLTKTWSSALLNEYEIYPKQVLRVIKGLHPLEISIVISDEPGYYSVLEVLDRFNKGSIPPFNVIKPIVEKRFTAEIEKIAIEKYIDDLYLKNEIEINY